MPVFREGDRVRRNAISDNIWDANDIPTGCTGDIIEIRNEGEQPYFIEWTIPGTRGRDDEIIEWWMAEEFFELLEPNNTPEAIIRKIKYLDNRYAARKQLQQH